MTRTTHGAAVIIAAAILSACTLRACASEPAATVDDSQPPRPAMTIERNGATVISITLYKPDGSKAAVIFPDGMVNIEPTGGTPDEVARLFWYAIARNLQDCAKP